MEGKSLNLGWVDGDGSGITQIMRLCSATTDDDQKARTPARDRRRLLSTLPRRKTCLTAKDT